MDASIAEKGNKLNTCTIQKADARKTS